ncbi:hypothetical protein AGMMS49921_07640 [Endomicrobiia bacterium]|nr:hypothetical protein AGMMS49921_07640 [Endomicrobiia bacterium]
MKTQAPDLNDEEKKQGAASGWSGVVGNRPNQFINRNSCIISSALILLLRYTAPSHSAKYNQYSCIKSFATFAVFEVFVSIVA